MKKYTSFEWPLTTSDRYCNVLSMSECSTGGIPSEICIIIYNKHMTPKKADVRGIVEDDDRLLLVEYGTWNCSRSAQYPLFKKVGTGMFLGTQYPLLTKKYINNITRHINNQFFSLRVISFLRLHIPINHTINNNFIYLNRI